MKYRDFLQELLVRGCYVHRTGGKHIIYRHPKLPRNIVVTKAKQVSPGLYRDCNKLLSSVGS